MKETKLNELVINQMTKAQYNALESPNENEIYLIDDDTVVVDELADVAFTGSYNDLKDKPDHISRTEYQDKLAVVNEQLNLAVESSTKAVQLYANQKHGSDDITMLHGYEKGEDPGSDLALSSLDTLNSALSKIEWSLDKVQERIQFGDTLATDEETQKVDAVGLKALNGMKLTFWTGTKAEYDTDLALGKITTTTLCFITDQ